jgi:hypothetical protein
MSQRLARTCTFFLLFGINELFEFFECPDSQAYQKDGKSKGNSQVTPEHLYPPF